MTTHSGSVGTALLVTCLLAGAYFVEALLGQIMPMLRINLLGGLTFVGLLVAFFATSIFGAIRWRKASTYWMMPCLISLAGLSAPFITLPVGEAFNDWQFRSHIADYERVVDQIRGQELLNSPDFVKIELAKIKTPPHIIGVWAARCADKTVIVHFFVGGARYQRGYLFKGCDDAPLFDSRRPREQRYKLRPLIEHWYYFSDVS